MFSEAEGALLAWQGPIDSDVLKVVHYGSHTSSRPDFIQAVSPAAAVISVGADNGFGHPHAEGLILRLAQAYEQATEWHKKHADLSTLA